MWIWPLYLHVNQKSDDDDDDEITFQHFLVGIQWCLFTLKLAYHSHLKYQNYSETLAAIPHDKILSADRAIRPLSLLVCIKSSVLLFLLKINNNKKKCEKILHFQSSLHFFRKKWQCFAYKKIQKFNLFLTNNIVSFEQLGPDIPLHTL